MQCPACNHDLQKVHTKQGVIIDYCPDCKGVWLDEGEIYMFSQKPKWLAQHIENGLSAPHASPHVRKCPHCQEVLVEGGLVQPDLLIDQCPSCKGLWFDDGELKKALELGPKNFAMSLSEDKHGCFYAKSDKNNQSRWQESNEKRKGSGTQSDARLSAIKFGMIGLPNLALKSTLSFVVLYGILFFMLLVVSEILRWPSYIPIAIAIVMLAFEYAIGPWLFDLNLRWFYNMSWVDMKELPDWLATFIGTTCKEKKMAVPDIGIIEDLAPNAFTYGRTPNDARVVITRGILNYLEPDEVKAVVAHELGHARHWDILVMMLAALVPMVLYYIYRGCSKIVKSSGKDNKGKGPFLAMMILAYIVYIVSEYLVLWLSRTREYFADKFSAEVTGNPNALTRALIKIAYGLVAPRKENKSISENGKDDSTKEDSATNLDAIRAFSIFDRKAAQGLALSAYSSAKLLPPKSDKASQEQDTDSDASPVDTKDQIASVMQWDLWNPWAAYYELHSTHPLPAKRINALTDQAAAMNQEPYIVFNRQKPESYWDEFVVDVFIHFLPMYPLLGLIYYISHHAIADTLHAQSGWRIMGLFLVAIGLCYLMKVMFCYKGDVFPKMKIASLLSKVKVSEVRPVPVTLTGKIVGRGIPGYMFSEDMVMQDSTGIIFLDYSQPLSMIELFFALFRTNRYIGQNVTVQGWYRRAPIPYIEVKSILAGVEVITCYTYAAKLVFAAFIVIGGLICFMKAAGMF